VVDGSATTGQAASASQIGRFETEGMALGTNWAALTDLTGQWIDWVHAPGPVKTIVLDMDSSVSPTFGQQEGTAYNGRFGCTCHHPLFVFNQFGDLERCTDQRPSPRRSAVARPAQIRPLDLLARAARTAIANGLRREQNRPSVKASGSLSGKCRLQSVALCERDE
jgi:hypothetical protein